MVIKNNIFFFLLVALIPMQALGLNTQGIKRSYEKLPQQQKQLAVGGSIATGVAITIGVFALLIKKAFSNKPPTTSNPIVGHNPIPQVPTHTPPHSPRTSIEIPNSPAHGPQVAGLSHSSDDEAGTSSAGEQVDATTPSGQNSNTTDGQVSNDNEEEVSLVRNRKPAVSPTVNNNNSSDQLITTVVTQVPAPVIPTTNVGTSVQNNVRAELTIQPQNSQITSAANVNPRASWHDLTGSTVHSHPLAPEAGNEAGSNALTASDIANDFVWLESDPYYVVDLASKRLLTRGAALPTDANLQKIMANLTSAINNINDAFLCKLPNDENSRTNFSQKFGLSSYFRKYNCDANKAFHDALKILGEIVKKPNIRLCALDIIGAEATLLHMQKNDPSLSKEDGMLAREILTFFKTPYGRKKYLEDTSRISEEIVEERSEEELIKIRNFALNLKGYCDELRHSPETASLAALGLDQIEPVQNEWIAWIKSFWNLQN